MENNDMKAKSLMNAVYGCAASQVSKILDDAKPSEYIQRVKDQLRRPGRPVTIGSGRKLSIYLPLKTLALMERIQEQWSFESQSDLIQEAIARYAADLDGVIKEGEKTDEEYDSALDPCYGCDDYDGIGGCKSKGGCGSVMEGETNG